MSTGWTYDRRGSSLMVQITGIQVEGWITNTWFRPRWVTASGSTCAQDLTPCQLFLHLEIISFLHFFSRVLAAKQNPTKAKQ